MTENEDLVLLVAGLVLGLFVALFFQLDQMPTVAKSNGDGAKSGDIQNRFRVEYPNLEKLVSLRPDVEPYLSVVQASVKSHASIFRLDPLLVLAVIRHESSFDAMSISSVGAAGPMQFMPQTGQEMGLDPVYESDVLEKAFDVDDRARNLYSRALRLMRGEKYDRLPSVVNRWKRVDDRSSDLFTKYRDQLKEIIKGKSQSELMDIDRRFVIHRSVPRGVKYLAELFKKRDGDLREALSAYNAGPGSVRRHSGIPPYDETVNYQNGIVNTYRKYIDFLGHSEYEDQSKMAYRP